MSENDGAHAGPLHAKIAEGRGHLQLLRERDHADARAAELAELLRIEQDRNQEDDR